MLQIFRPRQRRFGLDDPYRGFRHRERTWRPSTRAGSRGRRGAARMRARDRGIRSCRKSASAIIEAASSESPFVQPTRCAKAIARLRQNFARFPGRATRGRGAGGHFRSMARAWLCGIVAMRSREIAAASGWSVPLLDESVDALLAPFSRDALASFAAEVSPRARVGGFIMPANVPGAGMHELVTALISGAGGDGESLASRAGLFSCVRANAAGNRSHSWGACSKLFPSAASARI